MIPFLLYTALVIEPTMSSEWQKQVIEACDNLDEYLANRPKAEAADFKEAVLDATK